MKDGLEALREQMDINTTMGLIERTAKWVDRKTFEYLPIWFPEESRRDRMYKKNWSEPLYNTSKLSGEKIHKRVGNGGANKALTMALGLHYSDRPNWTCCHIWGIDDPSYKMTNTIASDKRYYSCVANMILLPTPLKAFSDVMQEVKDMLRIASAYYYGWVPDNAHIPNIAEIEARCKWSAYPESWSKKTKRHEPMGVVEINSTIRKSADRQIRRIKKQLEGAGVHYPRTEVYRVLEYWNIGMQPAQPDAASFQ